VEKAVGVSGRVVAHPHQEPRSTADFPYPPTLTDVGTLCYLAGLKDPEHAASGPLGGAIMETAVLSEIVKTLTHRGIDPQVYFWRTITGTEVDFVVETGGKLVPIEVKLSATPRPAMASARNQDIPEGLGRQGVAGVRGASGRYNASSWPGRDGLAVRRAVIPYTLAAVQILTQGVTGPSQN
jgi:hypothetical protein